MMIKPSKPPISDVGRRIHSGSADQRRVFAYFAGLVAIISITDPSGGLIDLPVSFILKNKMGLNARDISIFRVLTAIPFYLSVFIGLFRDRLNVTDASDRQMMMMFSVGNLAAYIALSFCPVSYASLLTASLISTSFYLFIVSAQSGLMASFAQRHSMSGTISALWNSASYISVAVAFMVGGYISQSLVAGGFDQSFSAVCYVGAIGSLMTAAFAYRRPKTVFECTDPIHSDGELRTAVRLSDLRSVYPALAVWMLWNFAPGSVTPLQFFLQNTMGASDAQWGTWNATFTVSFLPAFIIYGFLSNRVPFRRLLYWSAAIAIPQFVPLLFIRSPNEALLFAVVAGLLGGMATAAYLDLIIRACPPGLHGTAMMMAGTVYFVSTRLGDVFGAYLYETSGGFVACVFTMTAVYVLIFLILHRVP